jgi:LCP family protein required for cell wall assembly
MGIDYAEPGSYVSRSDSLILSTFKPRQPYVGLVSIPRDLLVTLYDGSQDRINTAHFFAEADSPGSGPGRVLQTIQNNFGINPDYYIRLRFEGFREIFKAMGGVDITLEEPMGGYPVGDHHLTYKKALAFARDRSGSDDFFRMEQGQIIFKSALKQMLKPNKWLRWPAVYLASRRAVESNIPSWMWPGLALTILRTGLDSIDNRIITREMVTPLITDQGASVLDPNWGVINPLIEDIFGNE